MSKRIQVILDNHVYEKFKELAAGQKRTESNMASILIGEKLGFYEFSIPYIKGGIDTNNYLLHKWYEVAYKTEFTDQFILTDNSPRPIDKKPVLVLIEGECFPYVSWLKTWSSGAFWIIPGGVPERHSPFRVIAWCDALPDQNTYIDLVKYKL